MPDGDKPSAYTSMAMEGHRDTNIRPYPVMDIYVHGDIPTYPDMPFLFDPWGGMYDYLPSYR